MYAIIRTGGKQYRVQAGDVVQVSKLENPLGSEFDIRDVLMIGSGTSAPAVVGVPTVSGAKVTVVVTKQARTRKLIVFKKKRRQGYRRFNTHRQDFTELFVKAITSPDGKTEKSDVKPRVSDVAAERVKRVEEKIQARREALDNRGAAKSAQSEDKAQSTAKQTPVKKTVKKVAKKATASGSAKKPAKKAAAPKKKTTKKA